MCDSAGELDFEPSSVRCRNLVGGSPNSFIVFWAKGKSARSLRLLSGQCLGWGWRSDSYYFSPEEPLPPS